MSGFWHRAGFCADGECVEVGWHKAAISGQQNCVEVGWAKASASGINGNCVEVGTALEKSSYSDQHGCVAAGPCACGGEVLAHDTKCCDDPDHCGQKLAFSREVWREFLAGIKAGELSTS